MPSTIAWLDSSREEQRRMREVINLFAQTESRDELGIGQVRDAFSDLLFPGTSTLHTRARYLLLIPWCYRSAAKAARDAEDLERRASQNERRLIVALNDAGATDGLIGRQVLTKLKTLPSTLYWSALGQYGVLVGGLADECDQRAPHQEADELVERAPHMWDVPPPPEGFPETASTLDLSFDEAVWVKDHLVRGSRGSLLEVLLTGQASDWLQLEHAWDVPTNDPDLTALRQHARLFSLCVHGAALSYNLALAKKYDSAGYDTVPNPVDRYSDEITGWIDRVKEEATTLSDWDLPDMWSRVKAKNPNVSWATRRFFEDWVELLRQGASPDDGSAMSLVCARERAVKKTQSRLINEKLLRGWSGASGTRPLTYRWSNVQQLVGDVVDGLSRATP
ncbi:conserved protein of unknown function [Modestobacter italicus]|uniref:Uncharacterized protein n=1 Tax=Modestobacter italicus (strain DSM 44449 / CECT 9708 / BC 501) TaxID=2732864 RepID=I4F1L0_MODI5|nr:DUF6361 family protein [Modestobacter marinus]CCH89523.1 conserved protein of unknown function [Modestobacter marinus]